MTEDSFFMRKAIQLARKAFGQTSPNPNVGAVIVKKSKIIGAGYHHKCGCPHAEIEALNSLKNIANAKGATIYVTLEPCSSYGRTPPCCDAIIKAGIAKVVIGCLDPNPKHAGKGVDILRNAGIEVVVNVLEKECKTLNSAFFHWITTRRPYVLLKMAETIDGKIATQNGDSKWITGDVDARKRVAHLRIWCDAILVGANTFKLDTPKLTARNAKGETQKTPRRFVVSNQPLDIPTHADDSLIETVSLPNGNAWNDFLTRLGNENITALLIEGGGEIAASALRANVVDEIEFHIAPKILGGRNSRTSVAGDNPGQVKEALPIYGMKMHKLGNNYRINGFLKKQEE